MSEASVYGELAAYYERLDRVDRDATAEAETIDALLRDRVGPGPLRILDVGCGVGTHLRQLEATHECTGFDLNRGVLDVAADRTDETALVRGDMHALPFDGTFDAVVSLFHTLAYADSVEDMHGVLAECYEAIRPGGALVVELAPYVPAAVPDDVGVDHETRTVSDDDVTCTAIYASSVEGRELSVNCEYVVARAGEASATHYSDTHTLTLFTVEEVTAGLRAAGFEAVEFDPDAFQTGGFLATKPD